ncbi:MAG: 50S ribosomal protein L24 [Candidatus Sericytochromatia bacterium]|nr:50S ribosomal protein L24 [Candidatus Sericytochromatia bacterium]
MPARLHVRKGDTVVIVSGKDKGKTGEVLRTSPKKGQVTVQGANMITRATKASPTNPNGGLIKREAPLASCKVMLWDPTVKKGVRVGKTTLADGRKVRVSKAAGSTHQFDK